MQSGAKLAAQCMTSKYDITRTLPTNVLSIHIHHVVDPHHLASGH